MCVCMHQSMSYVGQLIQISANLPNGKSDGCCCCLLNFLRAVCAHAQAHAIIHPIESGFISIELVDWPHYDGFASAKPMRFRLLLSIYLHIETKTINVHNAGSNQRHCAHVTVCLSVGKNDSENISNQILQRK